MRGTLTPEQWGARLAKGAPAAVLLLGKDGYLREYCRERLIEAVVEPGAREWGVSRFSAAEGEFRAGLAQARTAPMLAPRQVVILRDVEAVEQWDEKPRDAAVKELAEYLEDPPPYTTLVLEAEELDQRMKLVKTLEEGALVVTAELPEEPEQRLRLAAALAARMAQERGVRLEGGVAEDLAELCATDLGKIRSEMEKLATYAGPGGKIGREEVDALVVSEKKYSVWELARILGSGKRDRAFAFLDSLLREGEEMPAVVGAMAWMYRALLQVQEMGPRAYPEQVASRLRMRREAAKVAVEQARRLRRQELIAGLEALAEADSRLKQRGSGRNQRAVMEFLVARLTRAEGS